MKTLLTFIFLLILTTQINSQPTWNYQSSGTTNDLNKIVIQYNAGGNKLYVAGDNGTILRSSNNGMIWENLNSNTNADLKGIYFYADTGYAVGSNGTIIKTSDGGNNWSNMISNTTNTLNSISGNYAVGENGTFLKLVNGNWTVSQIDTSDINSIYAFSQTQIVVGNYGLILRSTNNGLNWTRLNSNTNKNLYDITNVNYIVGDSGTALRINGNNVSVINSGTLNNLYGIEYSYGPFLACGTNGTILKDWIQIYSNSNENLNSIIQTNSDNCFVAGDNGKILFTNTLNVTPNSNLLNSNNISEWFRNNGSFNRNPSTGNSGFEWPKGSGKFARYASGLWLGAKVGNDTLVAIAEYSYEYLPGYIDNSGNPQGNNDPLYKVYSITRGDTASADYLNWPANQGAYLNSQGKPFTLGTQTMFYSYTDGYPSAHGNRAGSTAPMKAVILQTNWSYINVNMQDVAFTEFKVINRNNLPWNDAYIAVWSDDDLGYPLDDAVGCDTNLSLGYTYNYDANDQIYGTPPPSVGFLLLRSPVVPSFGDTARYFNPPGSNNLVIKPNYKQTGLSSFNNLTNSVPCSDPRDYHETYDYLQGKRSCGIYWINPINNQPTIFPYSGDPETGTGWNMNSGAVRRITISMGPLNMNPGDTQSVVVAQLIAKGSNNLNSVTKLKELSGYVKGVYDNNFQGILGVSENSAEIPEQFTLSQNYPNPFNPATKINYELPASRGERVTNYVSFVVYDVLGKEVKSLVNQKQNAGKYEIDFNGNNLSSGVYFYTLFVNGNAVATKRMLLLK